METIKLEDIHTTVVGTTGMIVKNITTGGGGNNLTTITKDENENENTKINLEFDKICENQ